MTSGGRERLEEELKRLKYDERPAVIKAIAEAREHGDLSENAEYHAARERQSFIEGRVLELPKSDSSTISATRPTTRAHC
jgi:transcription elongation factor GreA